MATGGEREGEERERFKEGLGAWTGEEKELGTGTTAGCKEGWEEITRGGTGVTEGADGKEGGFLLVEVGDRGGGNEEEGAVVFLT